MCCINLGLFELLLRKRFQKLFRMAFVMGFQKPPSLLHDMTGGGSLAQQKKSPPATRRPSGETMPICRKHNKNV